MEGLRQDDAPEIPILLLGDAGVGKSTFLSYVFRRHLLLALYHYSVHYQKWMADDD